MADTLTPTERRILAFLNDYLRRNTYQPSIREIGRRFGIRSTKTVSEHMQALADKGYIERDPSRSRGVRICGLALEGEPFVLPVYGRIAAGEPMLLDEHIEARVRVDPGLVSSPDSFVLRVAGQSMRGMGILDGDLVVIEPAAAEQILDGEIVAARLGGEGTVKRFFAGDADQPVLEPANPDFPPIVVRSVDDFAVLGRVTGLLRRFTREQTEPAAD